MILADAALPSPPDVSYVLYIVAFSLFIYGLAGLTGPRTAVRGPRSMCRPVMNIEKATM